MDTHESALLFRELGHGGVRIVNRRVNNPEAARLLEQLRLLELESDQVAAVRELLKLHRKNLIANGSALAEMPPERRILETIRVN